MSEIRFAWVDKPVGGQPSIYMTPDYNGLVASYDKADARFLQIESGNSRAYLPLLIRCIGNGVFEAYSTYGYGGLLGDIILSEADVEALNCFLANDGVVAVFIRHSPFLGNQKQWPSDLVEFNRRTYSAKLISESTLDTYIKWVPQKLRWSINYARRAGLEVSFYSMSQCDQERISAFYDLYADLMSSKRVSRYYMFSESVFLDHAHLLGSNCELAEIVDPNTGELLAGAFFLTDSAGWVHYHLSASSQLSMKLQAMELLMASALCRYGNRGYKMLHLGGGHALDESDGLSRFKCKFSTERLDFCCTKLVCNASEYQAERGRLPLQNPGFFLVSDARGW